ncbi:efflux transporter outer membrane subunit [Wielerella bovis]|uniref:efflux transporter outer membrane subunit n=1 Tax=Wielerella bovis TaxID=2917790 RepID=UPI002018A652|nr:efflux transporter outer membrane subunit [Wielerella bovis]ULJ63563.1 efflux transporter outer membrane subunit [Wielerella bovis]
MKLTFHTFSGRLLLAFALSACQSTTVDTSSQIHLPENFSQADANAQAVNLTQWWQNWHDPVLNQLIERGLQTSPDIQIAQSRLDEARAQARLAQADLGAQVGVTGNIGATRGAVDNPLANTPLAAMPMTAPFTQNDVDIKGNSAFAGISASWEPDIFGGKRSDRDAATAAALSQQQQFYGAQVLLSGDIAEHYFHARALQAQQKSTAQSIAALERLVQYTQGRFRAGHVSAYEVNQAQSNLTAMRGQAATLHAQYAQHVRAIAVLIGDVPQSFRLPESSVNVLANPATAPIADAPQDVINRRPDLRARAAAVQARAAQVASAKADLLPRFSINFLGQGGRIGISGDDALKGWASLLSVGIQVPLFTNGRIQANIDAADARLKTALLEYDKNLLQALADVDNAYHIQAALSRQNDWLTQAQRQTAKQASDAQRLFQYGNKTLDDALRARISDAQAQEQLVQSQLARAQALVGLYKALGGGWTE